MRSEALVRAAFRLDYVRQFAATGVAPRLLFLTHRYELLDEARKTFRQAMHDPSFGKMLDGNLRRICDEVIVEVGTADRRSPASSFTDCAAILAGAGTLASPEIRQGTELDWREIELSFLGPPVDGDGDGDGDDTDHEPEAFATIFRDPIDSARLRELPGWRGWRAHLDDLCGKLEDVAPRSNARWVQTFLREVKTIYHFTPHHAERSEEAMEALRKVMWSIQQHASPAISYAEGEGYYDHEGSLLTWEFDRDDGHRGTRVVALQSERRWLTFSIDLAASDQREGFQAGIVPAGARLIGA